MAELDPDALHRPDRPGEPAGYSCPDCGGTLFRVETRDVLRYRCRVGHAWTAGSLSVQQTATHETALWTALRSLEERAALNHELEQRSRRGGHVLSAQHFAAAAEQATSAAELVRELLTGPLASGPDGPGGAPPPPSPGVGDRTAG